MSMVRLQCPACMSIVKINEVTAAQHPLVRCASCQGLVTVATSRLSESAAFPHNDEELNHPPRIKKRKSSGIAVPVGMMVGIFVGLLLLVGTGVGLYFLINHFSESPLEKSFKRAVAIMERMADAVEGVQSPQDLAKAVGQINTAITDLKQLEEQNRASGTPPNAKETKRIAEKYLPDFLILTTRIQSAMMKLSFNPAIAQAFKEQIGKLEAGLGMIAKLGGGLKVPGADLQSDFGSNIPQNIRNSSSPSQANGAPPASISLQQLESSLMAKNLPSRSESSHSLRPASSGRPSTSRKSERSNPFEAAGIGGSSKPAVGNASTLKTTIAKLNSNEHYRKQEGLREAQAATVEEASKAVVLEALLKLCDDNDVHQKVEVLKACKKWATTQEDKERVGEHAESLLKDHWARKDALRYFGENKVISASKEVAYLLKDNFDRKDAAETLISMGNDAEKAVIPHLTDLEPSVRQMAIEVLARIGTTVSISELQKLKSDRFVGKAASQAITLINARRK